MVETLATLYTVVSAIVVVAEIACNPQNHIYSPGLAILQRSESNVEESFYDVVAVTQQTNRAVTLHAVSYREGTSVGNGCGVRGQTEGGGGGEPQDHKKVRAEGVEERGQATERHSPVKQFERKFCMSHSLFQIS